MYKVIYNNVRNVDKQTVLLWQFHQKGTKSWLNTYQHYLIEVYCRKPGLWAVLCWGYRFCLVLILHFEIVPTLRYILFFIVLSVPPEHLSSHLVFSGVRVTRSLVLCVCFVDRCLSFCPFSFGHCVFCSSSLYGFWLPLWYLQTLLTHTLKAIFMLTSIWSIHSGTLNCVNFVYTAVEWPLANGSWQESENNVYIWWRIVKWHVIYVSIPFLCGKKIWQSFCRNCIEQNKRLHWSME